MISLMLISVHKDSHLSYMRGSFKSRLLYMLPQAFDNAIYPDPEDALGGCSIRSSLKERRSMPLRDTDPLYWFELTLRYEESAEIVGYIIESDRPDRILRQSRSSIAIPSSKPIWRVRARP